MNFWLVIGGCLSILAGVLHLVIIVKGANWFKFFGAGEKIVALSEKGSWIPGGITFLIALVLIVWGLYAFSGAGLMVELPHLKLVIQIIAIVYLLRGLVILPIYIYDKSKVNWFVVWSSALSFLFGMFYLTGFIAMR